MPRSQTIAVIGAGPAGLVAALALARVADDVTLIAPAGSAASGASDQRTAALFAGSIELLRNLGVWEACRPQSERLTGIRIVDDTGSVLRAPEILFTATEVGLEAFGYNVPNATIASTLRRAIAAPGSGVAVRSASVSGVELSSDSARIALDDGATLDAALVVGADGRNSIARRAAGIETRTWSYPQSALACSFDHQRPHRNISTELHRKAGPLTTVPLPGLRSSLVWVDTPEEVARLTGLGDGAFLAELERRLQGLLGPLSNLGSRGAFPLSGLSATDAGRNRVALIGEAAHVVPPIGAQGLNLGLRDVATLADCVADALSEGRDPGAAECLARYAELRRGDIASRIAGIDILNRSLLADFLPVHLLRGLGLYALGTIGPLRRLVVREGLAARQALPSLMRPHLPRVPPPPLPVEGSADRQPRA